MLGNYGTLFVKCMGQVTKGPKNKHIRNCLVGIIHFVELILHLLTSSISTPIEEMCSKQKDAGILYSFECWGQ